MVRPSITCLLAKNPRLNNSQTYFRSRKRWPQHPPHFVQQVNNTYCIVRPSRRCGWYKTPRDGVIMHSSWTLRLNVCFSWSTLYQSDCVVFPYRLLLLIFPYFASSPLSRKKNGLRWVSGHDVALGKVSKLKPHFHHSLLLSLVASHNYFWNCQVICSVSLCHFS